MKGCLHYLFSRKIKIGPCNIYCKRCRKSGNKPNNLGKFVTKDGKVLCTGCRIEFLYENLTDRNF